jgi:hypothetical protein
MSDTTQSSQGALFQHIPHPHLSERHHTGSNAREEARAEVHGTGRIGKLNAKIGLRITLVVGTMWCAYLFTLLALISAPSAFKSGNSLIIIAWIAQTFLQLVLLPIIIVGQNIQAKTSDKRADDTYKDAEAIMHECLQLQQHLQAQDDILTEMISHARKLISVMPGA